MSKDRAINREEEILNEFINLAINRFNWENLPLGLTSEALEEMLIRYGQVMGFKDDMQGLMILPCYGETKINVYGLPTQYRLTSLNGKYEKSIECDDGVLLKNNPLGTADIDNLLIYAKRISDIERTQEVNLFQQNVPKILLTDEDGKLTAKNLIEKLQNYKFALFCRKSLKNSLSKSDVLDTSSPYLLDKLQDYKIALKNELLTYLGINNNNIDKKERLLVDEVNANNELIEIMIDLMLDLREKFCKEFNSKFGTNIKVERRNVENGLYREENNNDNGIIGE